jgi:putative transposase
VIRKLREADRLLGEGQDVAAVAKQLEVSEQTLHRWRLQYGGLKAEGTQRHQVVNSSQASLKLAPSTSASHQVWSPGGPQAPACELPPCSYEK